MTMNSPPDNSGKPKAPPPRMGPTSAPPAGQRPPVPARQPMPPPARPAIGVKPPMPKVQAPVPEELDAGPTPLELPAQEQEAEMPELEADLSVDAPDEGATPGAVPAPLSVPAPSGNRTTSRQSVIAPPPPPGFSPPAGRTPSVIAPPPPPATAAGSNIAPVVAPTASGGSRPNMPPVTAGSRPNMPPVVGARPGAPLAGPGAVASAAPRGAAPMAGPGAVAGSPRGGPQAPRVQPIAMPPVATGPVPPLSPVPMATPGSMAAAAPPVARAPAGATDTSAEPAPIDTLLPATGGVDALSAEQAAQLGALAASLDQKDYFQLLGIPSTAAPAVIKKAFYSLSRVYHPDRFFHLTDEVAKDDINAIYKRVTEAYYVLRDDRKRKKYVADVGGAERATKLRFTEASEAEAKREVKKEAEEQIGTHPKGRQFWAEAEKCLARDDIDGAGRNLKMALTFEPGNARYKEELAKVQLKLDAKWKSSGDKFKIR